MITLPPRAKALVPTQIGQIASVIDMGMTQHHRI
jgi:hypothetical protein